jgi:hypothetical protein
LSAGNDVVGIADAIKNEVVMITTFIPDRIYNLHPIPLFAASISFIRVWISVL